MKNYKAHQQGQADSLCGLYALVNFLQTTDAFEDDEPTDILWHIFEQCEFRGWFSPYYIKGGYEEYQIQAIMDSFISNCDMPYRTLRLNAYRKTLDRSSYYDMLMSIGEQSGAAIVDGFVSDHWVSVFNDVEGMCIFDSDDRDKSKRVLSQGDCAKVRKPAGVVILPTAENA